MIQRLLKIFQIAALSFALLSAWGWLVLKVAKRNHGLPALAAESVLWIAKFPRLAKRVLRGDSPLTVPRAEGSAPDLREAHIPNRAHHVLVSNLNEEQDKPTIKLVRLHDGTVIHEWVPDGEKIRAQLESTEEKKSNFRPGMLPVSFLLHEDFSVVFNYNQGPLVRLDSASNIEWVINGRFHHSLEFGVDGNYWVPLRIGNTETSRRYGIGDDFVAQVSPRGEIVFTRSIFDLFMENGWRQYLVGGGHEPDPIHLNDIEPAFQDSDYWRRGDLFLSIRHMSLVLLYRPSTDEVLWTRFGPWLNQHDVDIIDSTRISVFGNDNLRDAGSTHGRYPWSMAENSDLYVYDFAADEISTPYSEAFSAARIKTETQGVSEIQPDGLLFVSETDFGRHLLLDSTSTKWEFVETDSKGNVLQPGWVRLLTRDKDGRFTE